MPRYGSHRLYERAFACFFVHKHEFSVLFLTLATAPSPAPQQDTAPAPNYSCYQGHLPIVMASGTPDLSTAWGLLQITFLCHRSRRDTTDMEKTTTSKESKHRSSHSSTQGTRKAACPRAEHSSPTAHVVLAAPAGLSAQPAQPCAQPHPHSPARPEEHALVFSLVSYSISFWRKEKRGISVAGRDFWPEQAQTPHTNTHGGDTL